MFESVIVWAALVEFSGWLPKLAVSGEIVASEACPAATSSRICGLPGALSNTVTTAFSGPSVEGVNPTSNEHFTVGPGAIA